MKTRCVLASHQFLTSSVVPILMFGVAIPASAEVWSVEIRSDQSIVDVGIDVSVPLAGTLIGDYDEKTNPGGTRTVPGVFGGSGNNPIPYDAIVGVGNEIMNVPSGTFEFDWTLPSGVGSISTMAIEFVGGDPVDLDVSLTIEFETFRTFNPDSLYPGGTPFTLPLGTATLSSLVATQSGPAPIAITSAKDGTWTFSGTVPVQMLGSMTLQGQPFDLGPFESVLPVSGTLVQTEGDIELSMAFETTQVFDQPLDTPIPDQLVELPTFLPPGQIANVIFSGVLESVAGSAAASGLLVAASVAENPVGDLNGDGTVNGADLTVLLADWGDPGGPADLDGDGTVGGADLTILLANWGESG